MNEKEQNMKNIGRKMNLYMAVTLSFFLSLIGMACSGHFKLKGWLISFVVSIIISLIIGFLIPIKKVTDSVCAKFNMQPGRLSTRCLESFISDLIFTPIMTLCMVYLSYSKAARKGAPVSFLQMYLPSLGICMVAGFILVFIFMPLFLKLIVGTPDKEGNDISP